MADTPPVLGVGGISGDLPRKGGFAPQGKTGAKRRAVGDGLPIVAEDQPEPAPDPTRALIEALDRLRATEEPLPSELAVIRALRGAKYYQDESTHGLQALSDDEPPGDDPGTVDRRG